MTVNEIRAQEGFEPLPGTIAQTNGRPGNTIQETFETEVKRPRGLIAQAGLKPAGVEWKDYEPVAVSDPRFPWSILLDLWIFLALAAVLVQIWRLS
jgi:hypothetical protein